jgi:hypothetical protein
MDVETRDAVIRNTRLLVEWFASELRPENIQDAGELLDHGEWGEAFDLICTQVYEYEVPVSREQYTVIEQTGRMLGMDSADWDYLKELIG